MTQTFPLKNDDITSVGTLLVETIGVDTMGISKIYVGADGVDGGPVTETNPFPVQLSNGTSLITTLPVSNAGTFAVQVDGDALTKLTDIETNTDSLAVVGGGAEATALRVTIANDSTGVVTVDDGGGSITVDGTVGISGTVTVDLGANNDVTVTSGSITVDNASGSPVPVELGDGTNQVDVVDVSGLGTYGIFTQINSSYTTSLSDGVILLPNGGIPQMRSIPVMFDGSSSYYRFKGDSTNGLLVNLGANNDVSVSGSVSLTGNLPDTASDDLAEINAALAGTLTVDASGQPVTLPNGLVDSFGHMITGAIKNQIDIQFYRDTPANLVTVTSGSGGTATATGGMATFAATTAASSFAKGVTANTTVYTAGAEMYALFTAAFTGTGSGTSYHRIGLYDSNDGFFIGYEAGTFGVTIRKGGSDVQTAKSSWSEDDLTGGASSKFTRGGSPEAIDLTKLNVFRIRFGWVGSAPIRFEVISPDGEWVTFHKILQPNLAALPSIENADLPVTCDVNSGNSSAALSILTNCWCAGTTQSLSTVDSTITDDTLVETTRSIITGVTTGGGGGYVNVKVSPSGAMEVGGTVGISGTVTVDNAGTFAVQATQAGTWNIGTVTAVTSITNPVTVTNAGTFAVQSAQSGSWSVSLTGDLPDTAAGDLAAILGEVENISKISDATGLDGSAGPVRTVSVGGTESGGTLQEIRVDSDGHLQVDVLGTVAATQSGTWNITNISGTISLPTGAATSALQTTGNSSLSTIAGAVSGSEMQVDVVAALPAGSNTIGTVNLGATDNAVLDNIDTNTTAAASHYRNVDANAEAAIKGSSGTLHWLHVMNMTAAVAYLHLYDATTASVTPGTTTPTYTFPIPTQGDTNGAGFNVPLGPNGQKFTTAITLVVTTTIDGSTGDPGTNGVFVNAGYT